MSQTLREQLRSKWVEQVSKGEDTLIVETLIDDVCALREALEILSVAVNDKVEDKGATLFITTRLKQSTARLKTLGIEVE